MLATIGLIGFASLLGIVVAIAIYTTRVKTPDALETQRNMCELASHIPNDKWLQLIDSKCSVRIRSLSNPDACLFEFVRSSRKPYRDITVVMIEAPAHSARATKKKAVFPATNDGSIPPTYDVENRCMLGLGPQKQLSSRQLISIMEMLAYVSSPLE